MTIAEMTIAEIKEKVKVSLRTKTADTTLIDEIGDCVDACIEDLKRSGAQLQTDGTLDLSDPLVLSACKMYARSVYGFEADSEKYKNCYEQIKQQLCMYSAYVPVV